MKYWLVLLISILLVLSYIYSEEITNFKSNTATSNMHIINVHIDNGTYVCSTNGYVLENLNHDYLFAVRHNGKKGLYDVETNSLLTEFKYNNIRPIVNDSFRRIIVEENGYYGIINYSGETLLKSEFSKITNFNEFGYVYATDSWGFENKVDVNGYYIDKITIIGCLLFILTVIVVNSIINHRN